jgi:hypothetical protein
MSRQACLSRSAARVALSVAALSALPLAVQAEVLPCLPESAQDDLGICLGSVGPTAWHPIPRALALKPVAAATREALRFSPLWVSSAARRLDVLLPITSAAFDGARMATTATALDVPASKAHAGGSAGSREIVNNGILTVRATGGEDRPAVGVGIAGGNGKDRITNRGTVDVTATATAGEFKPVITLTTGGDVTENMVLASSATGISGGNGKDTIANSGTVIAKASSVLDQAELTLTLAETAHASTTTTITAVAVGIDGGHGKDSAAVTNTGSVAASASARSNSFDLTASVVNAAEADGSLTLDATATGIRAGSRDTIRSDGSVSASADAKMVDVALGLNFLDLTVIDRAPSDFTTSLIGKSIGIDGAGACTPVDITGSGSVTSTASAFANSTGVSVGSEGVSSSVADVFSGESLVDMGITSTADAVGVRGGQGGDRIALTGALTATADAQALQQSVDLGVGVFNWHVPTPGFSLAGAGTQASGSAAGIGGGGGGDTITYGGNMRVDAKSYASTAIVQVDLAELGIDLAPRLPSLPLSASAVVADAATKTESAAVGIDAGGGNDDVQNTGTMTVDSTAESGSVNIAAALGLELEDKKTDGAKKDTSRPGVSVELDVTLARASVNASAEARGIDGGKGNDTISNEKSLSVTATGSTYAIAADVSLLTSLEAKQGEEPSLLGHASAVDASSTATSRATALAGDAGDDRLRNSGTADVTAKADALNVAVQTKVALEENGALVGVSLADADLTATASSVGLDGGTGKDVLENLGTVNAKAEANSTSVSADVAVHSVSKKGLAASVAVLDADTTSTATAVGMRSGDDDSGKDSGRHDALGIRTGDPVKAQCDDKPPVVDLHNAGNLYVDAKATTTAVNVSVDVELTGKGVAAGVVLSDTSAHATAAGTGIQGDRTDNLIATTTGSAINLTSTSQAVAVGVNLGLAGSNSGLDVGVALTRSTVDATSTAVGIDGGAGDDEIVNAGAIATRARSGEANGVQATATTVGVGLVATATLKQGAAVGAALTDTRAASTATVAGIDGGAGDDEVVNLGGIDLRNIGSDTTAVAVSLKGEFSKQGLTAGAALAMSDATSTASVTGIAGGSGDDTLVNQKTITAAGVKSDSNAVSVSLEIAGAKDGLVIGAALVDADATATSTVAGMAGGDGRDKLSNIGSIALEDTKAESDSVGVSVDIKFAKDGLGVGAALVKSGVQTTADVTGMAGGADDDVLVNDKGVTIARIGASADAVSVGVSGSGSANGLDIAAGLTDASATATAMARGLDGGSGDDLVVNRGRIGISDIAANGDATSVSVALAGANNGVAAGVTLADSSATSIARAEGISGGEGRDALWNKGEIVIERVKSDTDAVSVGATMTGVFSGGLAGGASLGRSRATAESYASGIAGGTGDDWVANTRSVRIDDVAADAGTVGVNVQLSVSNTGAALGAALVDTRATARTATGGLEGGGGDDKLVNTGTVSLQNLRSDAGTVGVGVSLNGAITGGVAGGAAILDGRSTAELRASGMAGDDGNDLLINQSGIAVGAQEGVVPATAQATAHATSVGVSGSLSMAGAAGGAAITNTSATASSTVRGLDGGAGDDLLLNEGTVDVKGRSYADTVGVSVNVSMAIGLAGGAALADVSSSATSAAYGLDGGSGRNEIRNENRVRVNSDAQVDATSVAVSAWGAGYTAAKASTTADSTAVGIRDVGVAPTASTCGEAVTIQVGERRQNHCGDDKRQGALIVNSGEVGAVSSAASKGISVAATLYGASLGDVGNTATARAAGIQSGAGRDRVLNTGALTTSAGATAYGLNVSANLFGAALGDASSTASGESTGIDTGAGDDLVENHGAITASAGSSASAVAVSAQLAGAANASATKASTIAARGIASGDGDDQVLNRGTITVSAGLPALRDGSADCAVGGGACAVASTVSVNLAGSGKANATTTATAVGLGIDGGQGSDVLDTVGTLTVGALARSRSSGVGVKLAGADAVDANNTASATSSGLLGGEGKDTLGNRGRIDLAAAAETYASGTSVAIAGKASAKGNTLSMATAIGLDGGSGDDVINNAEDGTMKLRATGWTGMSASAWTFAGSAPTAGTLGASASVTGLSGGDGADRLFNDGALDLMSTAGLSATGGSDAVFGSAAAGSAITASAVATAIDGGNDGDVIRNRGTVDLQANAGSDTRSTSFSFIGAAGANEVVNSLATASGIAAGSGDNVVVNEGRLTVGASATLIARGAASTPLGGTKSVANVTSRSSATGISAGSGSDTLVNDATGSVNVTVTAAPEAVSDASAGAFFVNGHSWAIANAAASGVGIDAGDGDNTLINAGKVTVDLGGRTRAYSESDPSWLANVFGIDSDAYADAQAQLQPSSAAGIRAGSGADLLKNSGEIVVRARPEASAETWADGDAIISGDGSSVATAQASAVSVTGIDAGAGDNTVVNRGRVEVTAAPSAAAKARSDADGADSDSRSTATAVADNAQATGIVASGGDNTVVNVGTVIARASPRAKTVDVYAGYGGDIVSVDSYSVSEADARGARALGILASGTKATVYNAKEALIDVQVDPLAEAPGFADGVGADGDVGSSSIARADDASAIGIMAAAAHNEVLNDGTVKVATDATARAQAGYSPGYGGEVEWVTESASARGAQATGIRTAGATDVLTNRGEVDVRASARAVPMSGVRTGLASSAAWGLRSDGAAELSNEGSVAVSALAEGGLNWVFSGSTAQASAFGLAAGNFANQITNRGTIEVGASALAGPAFFIGNTLAQAEAVGIVGGDGGNHVMNEGSIDVTAVAEAVDGSARAVGIRTGGGDDTIINHGTIETSTTVNGATALGVAIDAGAGNDTVILGNGSVTRGDIDLGSGTDTLLMRGTTIVEGTVMDDGSRLTLEISGSGSIGGALHGSTAIKNGEGTFSIASLPSLQRIEVHQGTLQVESDYQFRGDGLFLATVSGSGSGRFHVLGQAQLGGSLRVQRGGGPYVDGTTYEVLRADGGFVAGTTFDRIELPMSTRLVSFSAEQLPDAMRVQADVKSFTTVAPSRFTRSVARQLDRLLPVADGDLRQALGRIQDLSSDAEFAKAYTSMSPAAYDLAARASMSGTTQFVRTIAQRMDAVRLAAGPGSAAQEPIRFAYSGSAIGARGVFDAGSSQHAQYGAWMQAFALRGEQDTTSEISGYDHELAGLAIGIDHRFTDGFSGGLSYGQAKNTVESDAAGSSTDIDSHLAALYGNYVKGSVYLNGAVTTGKESYDSRRSILIGSASTPVTSRHDARTLSAAFGGGVLLRAGGGWIDPHLTLRYTQLEEDGFTETGGGAALTVAANTAEAFVSELGVRWAQTFAANGNSAWSPEASIGWLHDFSGTRLINAAYVGAPDASFAVEGQPVERDGALIGLGMTYRARGGFVSFLRYTAELRSGYMAQGVIGEIRYEF